MHHNVHVTTFSYEIKFQTLRKQRLLSIWIQMIKFIIVCLRVCQCVFVCVISWCSRWCKCRCYLVHCVLCEPVFHTGVQVSPNHWEERGRIQPCSLLLTILLKLKTETHTKENESPGHPMTLHLRLGHFYTLGIGKPSALIFCLECFRLRCVVRHLLPSCAGWCQMLYVVCSQCS